MKEEDHNEEDETVERKEIKNPSINNIGNGVEQADVTFALELVAKAHQSNPDDLEKQA